MGGSSFDLITQEVLRHQQIMEQLEQENRELKQQLADIREGRGIFLDICGKRFALMSDSIQNIYRTVPAPAADEQFLQEEPVVDEAPVEDNVENQPTVAIAHADIASIPEIPTTEGQIEEEEEKEEEDTGPTFLEEIMIDEFAAASTSPMEAVSPKEAVWSGPAQNAQKENATESIDEDKKAALRRELIGSFLLE